MKRVLITGAAGSIGRCLRQHMQGVYDELRLADIAPQAPAGPGETVMQIDIRDIASSSSSRAFGIATSELDSGRQLAERAVRDSSSISRLAKHFALPCDALLAFFGETLHCCENRFRIQMRFGDHLSFQPAGEPLIVPV